MSGIKRATQNAWAKGECKGAKSHALAGSWPPFHWDQRKMLDRLVKPLIDLGTSWESQRNENACMPCACRGCFLNSKVTADLPKDRLLTSPSRTSHSVPTLNQLHCDREHAAAKTSTTGRTRDSLDVCSMFQTVTSPRSNPISCKRWL